MATNPNTFCEEDIASEDITQRMRDLNEIEEFVMAFLVSSDLSWGTPGTGNGQWGVLSSMTGTATKVFVVGTNYPNVSGAGRVQRFALDGTFEALWAITQVGSIATNAAGTLVYTSGSDVIHKTNASGGSASQWGSTGAGNGQFNGIGGIAVDSVGSVYVSDLGNSRVQKFSSTGTYILQWGTAGTGDGQFQAIGGIATGPGNEIYVVDKGASGATARIQVFSVAGTFLRSWAVNGFTAGSSASAALWPTVHPQSGNVYHRVNSDVIFSRYTISSRNGTFIASIPGTSTSSLLTRRVGLAIAGNKFYSGFVNIPLGFPPDVARVDRWSHNETEFFWYTTTTKSSLGTPNGGASIPALDALGQDENDAGLIGEHLIDARTLIEFLSLYVYADPDNYNWIDEDDLNLYNDAMGNRAKYGATGGAKYDWTGTLAPGTDVVDINVGELFETVETMKTALGL